MLRNLFCFTEAQERIIYFGGQNQNCLQRSRGCVRYAHFSCLSVLSSCIFMFKLIGKQYENVTNVRDGLQITRWQQILSDNGWQLAISTTKV